MKKLVLFIACLQVIMVNAQKLTVQDILAMDVIATPVFSPDGKWVAFTKGTKKEWKNKINNDVWVCSVDGKQNRQLTFSDKKDAGAQWSPNGTAIAFLSARGEYTQVYYLNMSGGEAKPITNSKTEVAGFEWINDTTIVYNADEPRDSNIVKREKETGGAWVAGTQFNTSVLWYKTLNTPARKITNGKFYISTFSVADNGKLIAVNTPPSSDYYEHQVNSKVLVMDDKGNTLFEHKVGKAYDLVKFSPDGKKMAFTTNLTGYSAKDALIIYDVTNKTATNYTEAFSPTIDEFYWSGNDDVVFLTARNVQMGIYNINVATKKISTLLEPYWVIPDCNYHAATKTITFIGNRSNKTNQLYVVKAGAKPQEALALTQLNPEQNKKISITSTVIQFTGSDNEKIDAVISLPPGYNKGNKYPVMVLPHGGPDGIVYDGFHNFAQLFAQEGFVVYEPNFHGGIGYGAKFYASNRGRIGEIDYNDVMKGLDYLIKEGMVDTNKMVVGGWSFGGYMTNWIIGHTNRFKAAVSIAGISNTVSMYAQSDINHGGLASWEFKGVPVTDMENYQKASPVNYLKNCKTPTLILHGEGDVRVPVAQGWELYRALIDLGVEAKMVLYPDAPHGINTDPRHYADVLTNWMEWYRLHLK